MATDGTTEMNYKELLEAKQDELRSMKRNGLPINISLMTNKGLDPEEIKELEAEVGFILHPLIKAFFLQMDGCKLSWNYGRLEVPELEMIMENENGFYSDRECALPVEYESRKNRIRPIYTDHFAGAIILADLAEVTLIISNEDFSIVNSLPFNFQDFLSLAIDVAGLDAFTLPLIYPEKRAHIEKVNYDLNYLFPGSSLLQERKMDSFAAFHKINLQITSGSRVEIFIDTRTAMENERGIVTTFKNQETAVVLMDNGTTREFESKWLFPVEQDIYEKYFQNPQLLLQEDDVALGQLLIASQEFYRKTVAKPEQYYLMGNGEPLTPKLVWQLATSLEPTPIEQKKFALIHRSQKFLTILRKLSKEEGSALFRKGFHWLIAADNDGNQNIDYDSLLELFLSGFAGFFGGMTGGFHEQFPDVCELICKNSNLVLTGLSEIMFSFYLAATQGDDRFFRCAHAYLDKKLLSSDVLENLMSFELIIQWKIKPEAREDIGYRDIVNKIDNMLREHKVFSYGSVLEESDQDVTIMTRTHDPRFFYSQISDYLKELPHFEKMVAAFRHKVESEHTILFPEGGVIREYKAVKELAGDNAGRIWSGKVSLAAQFGLMDLVKQQIESVGDLDQATQEDGLISSLFKATEKGHAEIVRFLMDIGGNPNVTREKSGTKNYSVLMEAAYKAHPEVVKILIEKGAEVNFKDNYGESALMEACAGGHLEVVKLLLAAGADINTQRNDGWTPLIKAIIMERSPEVIKLLLEAGANFNLTDELGNTPLKYAQKLKMTKVATLLKDAGAE